MLLKSPNADPLEIWVDGTRTLTDDQGQVEVTGDVAKNLLEQGWERVDKPVTRKKPDDPTPKPDETAPTIEGE